MKFESRKKYLLSNDHFDESKNTINRMIVVDKDFSFLQYQKSRRVVQLNRRIRFSTVFRQIGQPSI